MDGLTFVPLTASYIAQIEDWLTPDTEESVSMLPMAATGRLNEARSQGWVALHDNLPVAIATLNVGSQGVGHLNFLVKPSERRLGIGASLVSYVLDQPAVRAVRTLEAFVEFDNTAAQKILTRDGFSNIGYTPDGRLRFEKR